MGMGFETHGHHGHTKYRLSGYSGLLLNKIIFNEVSERNSERAKVNYNTVKLDSQLYSPRYRELVHVVKHSSEAKSFSCLSYFAARCCRRMPLVDHAGLFQGSGELCERATTEPRRPPLAQYESSFRNGTQFVKASRRDRRHSQ